MAEYHRIEPRQRELFALFTAITGAQGSVRPSHQAPVAPPEPISADDAELLERGKKILGPAFARLIVGDRSDYGDDESDSDHGAIKDILHLTGHDEDRTEKILRALPLRRDKWDTRRGATNYLRYSIGRALKELREKGHSSTQNRPHTWPKLEVDGSEAGPANGHCSPHCDRHLTVIEAQKKVIAELRAENERLRNGDQASGKRLRELKQFRQASAFSGKRKDIIEVIGFEVDRARQKGESSTTLYYGDREAKRRAEEEAKERGASPEEIEEARRLASYGGIAAAAGTGPQSVGLAIELLREAKKEHPEIVPWRFVSKFDRATGCRRVVVAFDPKSTLERDLARLAELPKTAAVRKEPLRCPDCPAAKLRVTKTCKSCGQVVAEYDETPPRTDTPLVQTLDKAPKVAASSVVNGSRCPQIRQGPAAEWPPDPLSKPSAEATVEPGDDESGALLPCAFPSC